MANTTSVATESVPIGDGVASYKRKRIDLAIAPEELLAAGAGRNLMVAKRIEIAGLTRE